VSDLIRIVYVSRSTFPPRPAEHGIEPGVARILAQSRLNNPRRGLVGALYFRDGCFFQCLEGPSGEVDRLMATLRSDPRHTDLRVLAGMPIERTGFAAWSMKYSDIGAAMALLLHARGLSTFDPYAFDAATVEAVVELLRDGPDAPSPASGVTRAVPMNEALARRALRVAHMALGLAGLALAVAILAVASS
jgi:hypothetical protein